MLSLLPPPLVFFAFRCSLLWDVVLFVVPKIQNVSNTISYTAKVECPRLQKSGNLISKDHACPSSCTKGWSVDVDLETVERRFTGGSKGVAERGSSSGLRGVSRGSEAFLQGKGGL